MITEASQDLLVTIKGKRRYHIEVRIHDAEPLGHHADDLPRLRIDRDVSSYRGGVSTKTPQPIAIAQHHGFRTMRILVGLREPSASDRRNLQRLKHTVANQGGVDLFWLGDARDIYRAGDPYTQRLKFRFCSA